MDEDESNVSTEGLTQIQWQLRQFVEKPDFDILFRGVPHGSTLCGHPCLVVVQLDEPQKCGEQTKTFRRTKDGTPMTQHPLSFRQCPSLSWFPDTYIRARRRFRF